MKEESSLVEAAEEALHKISAGNVLDVATGSGGFISFLMENLKGYTEITGIDFNERPLGTARETHALENIHFLRMDAAQMDFADGHFDTVCIANSLHHMENLHQVLSEIKRVCKPGGHIIINEMFRDNQSEVQLTHVYLHHWWAAIDTAEGTTHFKTFTLQQLEEIIERMDLHQPKYYELNDLESDPKDPELIHELEGIIDRYLQRTENLDNGVELHQQGEELHQRVHHVGFHGATSLLVIGKR